MPNFSLQDKVLIVTGASSGIGQAVARQAARAGARLVLAARRADQLAELEKEITTAGGQALAVPTDVTDRDQINAMLQAALGRWGRVDMLFNNAGLSFDEPLIKMPPDKIHTELAVNLQGVIDCAQAVLKPMLKQRFGHIVNTASLAGMVGLPGSAVYCTTKWGVIGFSDALGRETGRYGVRVSAFCPGFIATDFSPRLKAIKEKRPDALHMPGVMDVEYASRKVIWLLQNPRRRLIIPHSWAILMWFAQSFPWGTDLIIDRFLLK